ncbi:MAG: hypothetical protein ACD_20C00044G0002 [uncultured bacterium]|nr:MAG: hypothetical protein ACD_20C00044G0002 [uncultured bacterium]
MQICNTCHAGCCRKHNIDVTGIDILNIVETLNLDISFFSEALPNEDEYVKAMLGKVPLFKFSDGEPGKYYRMCIKMRESVIFPKTLKCMFLQEWPDENPDSPTFNKIISRCGIYNTRPLTCSTYPAKLEQDGLSAHYFDPFEDSNKDESPAYKACPRPLTKDDFETSSADIMKNLVLYKFEMDFFTMLAEKWNKNPRSSDDLMDFLKEEYNNRVKFNPKKSIS